MVMSSLPVARVLVADDSVVCRNVLVILLETAGYEVIGVYDGMQALQALRTHEFDLAILDNDMPNLGGIGALVQLRGFLPQLPVVVCSGTVSETEAKHYRELGIDDLLSKPVDPRKLRTRVAEILSLRKARPAKTSGSLPPFLGKKPANEPDAACTLVAGTSPQARSLQNDLLRLRDFRSVAVIEGRPGSGRFELALQAASAGAHAFACHHHDVREDHLGRLIKPAADDERAVLLVVLEADQLSTERQSLLEELVRGRLAAHAAVSKRLRLILCSQASLSDLHFNEFLLLRAATSTYEVPDFARRRQDWVPIARHILRRAGLLRGSLSPGAEHWIESQHWPGDYIHFHRTVELARQLAGTTSVLTEAHFIKAVAGESDYDKPLFHDLLFAAHSTD
jgi:DNA-binding NtrC family response regulator